MLAYYPVRVREATCPICVTTPGFAEEAAAGREDDAAVRAEVIATAAREDEEEARVLIVVAGREVAAAAAPTAPPAARVEEAELLPAEALAPFGSGTPLLIVPYGLDGYFPKQLYSYCAS